MPEAAINIPTCPFGSLPNWEPSVNIIRERMRKTPWWKCPSVLEENMKNTKTIRELTVRLYIFGRDRLTSAFSGIYSIYCRVVDGIIAQVQFLHFAVCQIKFSALDFSYAPFALWRYFLKTHTHMHKHTDTDTHLFLEIFPVRLSLSHEWPDPANFIQNFNISQ